MIENLVARFLKFQLKIGTIKEDDINVYQYGYTLAFEVMLNLICSLSLGIMLGIIKEVIFFLCIFIPLRSFSGGYHADKAWKCIILSNLIVVGTVVVSKILFFNRKLNIVMIVNVLVIALLSPNDSSNRKLDFREKVMYKYLTLVVLIIELIIEIVLIFVRNRIYYNIVLISHIIQAVTLIFASKNIEKKI